jgi:hypothetical protein
MSHPILIHIKLGGREAAKLCSPTDDRGYALAMRIGEFCLRNS